MLSNTSDTKQHEELLIDKDVLCIQLSSGNPFMENQDIAFRPKKAKVVITDDVCEVVPKTERLKEIDVFEKQKLKLAENRGRRIPNNPYIKNAVGLTHLKLGHIEEAMESFCEALKLDKQYFAARANLARCYSIKLEFTSALKLYHELERERGDDVRVLMNIALQYMNMDQREDASNYLRKALAIEPGNPSALNNLGLLCLIENRYSEAISLIRKAVRSTTNDPILHNNLGVCLVAQGSLRKAVKHFMISCSLNKESKDAIHNLAQGLLELGDYEKTVDVLEDYLRWHQKDIGLRNLLAWSFFKLRLFEKALKELKVTLKETSSEDKRTRAMMFNNLGVAYHHLGHRRFAEEFFQKSLITLDKGELIAFLNLIDHYFFWNDPNKAKFVIDQGLSSYTDNPNLLGFLGDYYYKTRDYAKAKENFEKVIALNPDLAGPYLGLSSIEMDVNGNNEGALLVLESGLERNPDDPSLVNNYAYALINEDRLSEARRVLDQIGEGNDVYLNATRGILLIREGDLQEGNRCYNRARGLAMSQDKRWLAALVDQKRNLEIGRYYYERGSFREAKKYLRKGMSIKKTKHEFYRKRIVELLKKIVEPG